MRAKNRRRSRGGSPLHDRSEHVGVELVSAPDLDSATLDVASPELRTMQVLVFDRQIIEGQPPVYQAMTEGGLSTSRTFLLRCQKKQT